MKKLTIFLLLASLLAGCNNTPKVQTIKPLETTINGALSNYYRVVDKDYPLEDNWMFKAINVEIECISDNLPFDPEYTAPLGVSRSELTTNIGFGLELLDKSGNVVKTYKPDDGHCSRDDIDYIIDLSKGESYTMECNIDDDEDLLKRITSFRILSASKGYSTKNNTQSVSNSNDWDSVLDEYEKFVDNYIRLYKKAMSGDMSALTEYADYLESAEKLQTKLTNAQSTLTSAQLSRYTRITNKMVNAIQ